jgi:DNA-binding transcriptional regulator YhcF (GntR family)
MKFIEINTSWITPIYEQIKDSIMRAIEQGIVKKGDRVPSIHSICREFGISPGTVIKAYEDLCRAGLLSSVRGKGYFVTSTRINKQFNIFVLFDRINAYKEILYDSFMKHIGHSASVQVFFHHYDEKRFTSLIRENIGKYNFYVIMPHFNHDVSEVLLKIPENKLLIIDKDVPKLKGKYACVCQNFREDIYKALQGGIDQIRKYNKINFVRSPSKFQFIPDGCVRGFEMFVKENSIPSAFIANMKDHPVETGEVYLVYSDSDLIYLIKKAKTNHWQIGKDIGIIAFDDSPMKEVLEGGITVLSTDFEAMGATAAELVLTGRKEKLCNPFALISRNSL